MLRSDMKLPSLQTIVRDVVQYVEFTDNSVRSFFAVSSSVIFIFYCYTSNLNFLKRIPGRFHIGVDGWTSPNVISFIAITVHFVHDGKICKMILDFIPYVFCHVLS